MGEKFHMVDSGIDIVEEKDNIYLALTSGIEEQVNPTKGFQSDA